MKGKGPWFGILIGPNYPWPKYRGDVIPYADSSRAQVEDAHAGMTLGAFCTVVELDKNGDVIA